MILNSKPHIRQLDIMTRANLIYFAVGLVALTQISTHGAWKSFVAGWVVAVLNLEILKRLGSRLLQVYEGQKPDPMFYFLLFGKFAFWGLVIALFTMANWINAIPFAIGMTTLIVSGLVVGMKEWTYARAA
jgi:hypothetical protein